MTGRTLRGKRAAQAQPLRRAVRIQYQDRIVAQVIHHLAQRVEAALEHTDKDWVKKTIAKNRQKAAEERKNAAGPSKTERMRSKAVSPQAIEGHVWVVKEHKTNFTMKCNICGLYIESCKVGEPFERLMCTTAPGVRADDRRRLDVVIYGAAPNGSALCCDVTLVSPLTRTGGRQRSDATRPPTAGGQRPHKLLVLISEVASSEQA